MIKKYIEKIAHEVLAKELETVFDWAESMPLTTYPPSNENRFVSCDECHCILAKGKAYLVSDGGYHKFYCKVHKKPYDQVWREGHKLRYRKTFEEKRYSADVDKNGNELRKP